MPKEIKLIVKISELEENGTGRIYIPKRYMQAYNLADTEAEIIIKPIKRDKE